MKDEVNGGTQGVRRRHPDRRSFRVGRNSDFSVETELQSDSGSLIIGCERSNVCQMCERSIPSFSIRTNTQVAVPAFQHPSSLDACEHFYGTNLFD